MRRINQFLSTLDLSDYEIAAGLTNGEIERPDWMGVTEDTDHLKIWDMEDENACAHFGFLTIPYSDDDVN